MAAGLKDHRWSMEELLTFPVPLAGLPTWCGRKPRWLLEAKCAADHGSMWRYPVMGSAQETPFWEVVYRPGFNEAFGRYIMSGAGES